MNIYIVDDHELVLEGLATLLSGISSVNVIGKSTSGRQLFKEIPRLKPDIVITDLFMPETDGFEIIRNVKGANPDIKVIVLSMSEDETSVSRAIALGADGYVLKNEKKEVFEYAITAIMEGGKYFSPNALKVYIGKTVGNHPLTQREKEIATSIASGNSNQTVAADLSISVQTVATHRKNIYKKLGVSNTAALVSYAINQGWLS